MKRRNFIKASAGITTMATLSSLKNIADSLPETGQKMPVLFVGHGSPMNAIEDNEFTQKWQMIAKKYLHP
jgi:4,5-DOPA dioxygenase extradiol